MIQRSKFFAVIGVAIGVGLVGCGGTPAVVDPIPAHQTLLIDSQLLHERRRINVYLPPAYESSRDQFYPVLYMPDGGIQEDFPHIANTIQSLIVSGQIPACLVVGIENTERRRDLTPPTTVESDRAVAPVVGGSENFRHFIRQELIPRIETDYRCTLQRALVGESLAGLFVIETWLLTPELFESYIAVSPSVWWNNQALINDAADLLRRQSDVTRRLYVTSADETDIAPHTARLAETLTVLALPRLDWWYEPRPDLTHATIFRNVTATAFQRTLSLKVSIND